MRKANLISSGRMDELQARLRIARQHLSRTRIESRLAQKAEEEAQVKVGDIEHEIAWEQLQAWANKPDIAQMMKANGASLFYEAINHLAAEYGFSIQGKNAVTNQLWLCFSLPRYEAGAVERAAQGVLYFAKAMKPCPDGYIHFGLHTHDDRAGVWEFCYAKRSRKAKVAFFTYGAEQEAVHFNSLLGALAHVEAHLWAENVVDEAKDISLLNG